MHTHMHMHAHARAHTLRCMHVGPEEKRGRDQRSPPGQAETVGREARRRGVRMLARRALSRRIQTYMR